jgi:outer membrane protein assembly factor BamA
MSTAKPGVSMRLWSAFSPFLFVALSLSPGLARASSFQLFEVRGNERTETDYIAKLAQTCIEEKSGLSLLPDAQLSTLEQCLMNAKIFAKVSTQFVGTKIRIEVEEKWTLIPAPFFQSSGSTRKFGLLVFETNFLGQGLTLALGGNSSNRGNGFFGFFTDPSLFSTQYFVSLSASKDATIYEAVGKNDKVNDSFFERSYAGNVSVGYRFAWLNLSANIGRTVREYEQHERYIKPSPYALNKAGATVDYDRRNYKLYFSDGLFSRVRYSHSFYESDDRAPFDQWEGSVSYQFLALEDHAINLMGSLMKMSNIQKTDAERVGSTKGFRGIETKTAWAKSYFVQTFEYQVPIRSFERGTLTSAAFYDHGRLETLGPDLERIDYHAIGLGIYFYLSRIAIPGFGLEWGMNSSYQKNFVNFSIGLSY